MNYNLLEDIQTIRELTNISQEQLAKELDISQKTISLYETGEQFPSKPIIEKIYSFAFSKKIRINKLKEMFIRENLKKNNILLFHGSKNEIIGNIDISKSKTNNDFGQGFYAGESYEQAISFVHSYSDSSVYYLSFNTKGLKYKEYKVDQDWMLTIAYYRGALEEYKNHSTIKKLIENSRNCDYIIAPIADNRMFKIIDSFISGEITDEQCKHCLAATNLGMQYIFLTDKAIKQIEILERCYICDIERNHYQALRIEESKLGDDKVKLARRQYRGQGKYIDEILG